MRVLALLFVLAHHVAGHDLVSGTTLDQYHAVDLLGRRLFDVDPSMHFCPSWYASAKQDCTQPVVLLVYI